MAKWGEGDPRWIVEERPDATNVNNWHWSEKNASGWSKEKLKSLFEGMRLEAPALATISIGEVTKCEGEATVSNRKGKLIFFYEWVLTMDWTAELHEDDKDVNGNIEIPNLSEENEPEEIDINVTVTSGGAEGDKVKEYIRKKGITHIQENIRQYIETLKKEYALDLIKPTKGQDVPEKSKTIINTSPKQPEQFNTGVINTTNQMGNIDLGCKIDTTTINMSQSFKCTAEELYRVFTVQEMVAAFTRNRVKLEVEKGGKFELFDGNISGEFMSLEPNSKIVQTWRFKTWPSGHHSIVTLTLEQKEDSTALHLTQTGVPCNDMERTRAGWQNYYWESIKRAFGYGAMLV